MKMNQLMTICGIATALFLSVGSVSAQNDSATAAVGAGATGGQADPAQQRFMQRAHDGLGFTNEADWSAIEPLVQNVFAAQRDLASSGAISRAPAVNRVGGGTNGVGAARSVRRVIFGPAGAEAQALQKALDENASADEVKAALASFEAAQKAKRAKLEAAQETLRKALSVQQEARAALLKVLD